jgi:hypothetical protein
MIKADYDMHLPQIWNSLKSRYVNEGRTLPPPSPLFVHFDSQTIQQVEIHKNKPLIKHILFTKMAEINHVPSFVDVLDPSRKGQGPSITFLV